MQTHVIVPVRVGMGKSGTAKSGPRNVQTAGDGLDAFYELRALSRRCAALPGCETDATTITRQLLDLYPGQGVYEAEIKQLGVTLYLYRDGDEAALSVIRRRVANN